MAAPGANERPIIIRRVRRKATAAHHGGAWKVAYADFVTAMMAFFMLLWLLSTPDKEKLKGLAEYFTPNDPSPSGSTGETPGLGGRTRRAQSDSTTSNGQPTVEAATAGTARGGTANVPDASMRMLAQELKIAIDSTPSDPGQKNVRLDPERDGLRINLMDTANQQMFKGPTAELTDYAKGLLARIARSVAKSGSRIAIEGHTDSTGGQSDANWRLSGNRAQSARAAMMGAGLTPDRIAEVVAKAGTAPIYPDQPDRPENRRITVVVLGEAPALPSDVSFKF